MSDTKTLNFTATTFEQDSSLLAFVKIKCALSNRYARRVIEKGFCKINGSSELFASKKLKEKDFIEIFPHWENFLEEKQDSLTILFEDDSLIIIDKPSGLVCEDRNLPASFPKGSTFVHRLDQGTSGVMMVAKNRKVKEKMVMLFASGNVKKFYLAILDGSLSESKGRIESRLGRRSQKMALFGSMQNGEYALTQFRALKKIKKATLVLCQPVTGRTHQLRVHFFEKGHPILGDYIYAKKFAYPSHVKRLLLHSTRLEFSHPVTKEKMVFTSAPPEEFSQVMGGLPTWNSFSFV
jgi:RluA family pseudouridine synthase